MFHVKQDLVLPLVWVLSWTFVGLSASCGYQPLRGPDGATLDVELAGSRGPGFGAVASIKEGAESELARLGIASPATGYPRMVIEVLRSDEIGRGLEGSGSAPTARSLAVSVVAHAWVVDGAGRPRRLLSGDMRRTVRYAPAQGAAADAERRRAAIRQAATLLGRDLVRRVVGVVAAGHDPP